MSYMGAADLRAKVIEFQRENDRLRAALYQAETVMMIVSPRSHTAEYRECLATIRAALSPPHPQRKG